jgi:hypothetical protein
MEKKVQLKHPQRKKAVSMNQEKYDLLKQAVLKHLGARRNATFTDLVKGIETEFKRERTKFQGSLAWHLEWVKLDLEARRIIKRVGATSPQEYTLAR